jgi:predicted regulator of Ras-like GTPase activity (Roadblock/LC7/MglB family)
MADLRELVRLVRATPGVGGAVAVGRDGLLIDAAGLVNGTAEHVAALAPGLLAAADMLADAGRAGDVRAVVVEGASGVLLAMPLSRDVALVAALEAGGEGAGAALHALRGARAEYARLA